MTKELKCEFQKEIDNEKVCKAFEVNRYGDIICQEEDCQLCKLKAENERLRTCLQEIKKYIAKICKEECGYVQKKRCPDCDCRYGAILDLITKAESEEE